MDFMSKRFFVLLLALGMGNWNAFGMDGDASTAVPVQPAAPAEGAEFTRLPVSWKANPRDVATAKAAWKTLSAYHQGKPVSGRKLHVVYVTFKDRPALDKYRERYDHLLKNIQAYYADQMQANGFPPLTFKLDLDDRGRLIVHDAYVDKPMSGMNVQNSGPVSREAARKVLASKGIDIEKEHVLIICQLPDGVGPYYGGGFSHQGTGWTCDQEGLDPANFLDTSMMEGGRFKVTKGRNASIYIGGTAHELGHSFGLPHTGTGWDYPDAGESLMGSGNYTYGNELRKEGKGSFLSPTDALKLASVPLFNGVETSLPPDASFGRMIGKYVPGSFERLEAVPVKNGLRLKGKARLDRPAYGVVVHLDPPGGSDYDSNAVGTALNDEGEFDLTICRPGFKGGFIEMRVAVLNCDSTRCMTTLPVWLDGKGARVPSLAQSVYFGDVQNLWIRGRMDEAKKTLEEVERRHGAKPEVQEWLPVWKRALERRDASQEFTPAGVPADLASISLNDCKPSVAQVGWAVPLWDVLFPSDLGPVPFFKTIGRPERFILAHAPAVFAYDLNGAWKEFRADVGLPFGSHGSVRFGVYLDGKKLFESPVLKDGSSVPVQVAVEGGKKLEIRVDDAGDGNTADWGIIANGVLAR